MTGALGEQNELLGRQIAALDRVCLAADWHRHAADDLTEQVKELRQTMQARR